MRGFGLNKAGYVMRRLSDGFFGDGRANKTGYVLGLAGRIGINDQFRRGRVGLRRLRMNRHVNSIAVVATRM